jgi:hypothetical protein
VCDWTPVRNWLIGAAAAIVLAAVTALGAAAAGSSFYYSYLAPFGMLAAAAITAGAILLVTAAIGALDAFCACAGARCAGVCGNLRRTLDAARIVLGIQATAALTSAAAAWIPGIGQVPIYVIIGALFIQLALIISTIYFLTQLASCQTPPPPPTSGGPLTSADPPTTPTGTSTTRPPSTTKNQPPTTTRPPTSDKEDQS